MNAMSALAHLDFHDVDIGIVRAALEAPMRRLIENAGHEGAVIIANARRMQTSQKNPRIGYNVMAGEAGDMIQAGIPDPATVTPGAVESAASIVGMILTIEALCVT